MPARVQASARRAISVGARRLRLERPERRVALDVPLDDARLEDLPGRERRAADHAADVRGDHLLVADAVHDRRDRAVREDVRGRRDRRLRVHRLGRDDAELARRQRRCVARRVQPRAHVAAPVSRRPCCSIASTCACERSNAQTSTSSSVARLAANSEPTAPQPTMQTLMEPSLPRGSPRPRRRCAGQRELSSAGDPGRTQDEHRAMTAPRMMSLVPCGRSTVKPT